MSHKDNVTSYLYLYRNKGEFKWETWIKDDKVVMDVDCGHISCDLASTWIWSQDKLYLDPTWSMKAQSRGTQPRIEDKIEDESGNWRRPRCRTISVFEWFKYINKVALKLLSSLQNPTTSPSHTNTNTSSPRTESLSYKSPDIMWYYPCDKRMGGWVNTNWKPNTHKQVRM